MGRPRKEVEGENLEPETELEAENRVLKERIAKLEAALPKAAVAKEGHQFVFVSSRFASTTVKHSMGQKQVKKVVEGSINGIPFEVECDKQVEVSDDVAGALKGLLEAQKAG